MRGKTGIEDFLIIIIITSELWAALLDIRAAPADTLAHVITHGDTGVGADVVRPITNIKTVLIRIMTLEAPVCVVTV